MVQTVGHGTLAAEAFVDVLAAGAIELVVDVRRYPGSRRHPHFASDEMARWLPEQGIGYRWLPALGGRRRTSPDSPNVGLRNPQLRGYADHMATAEFDSGVRELAAIVRGAEVAVMCSEAVWWRCHRRLLADHLVLVEGLAVEHLFHDGRRSGHPVTNEARRVGGVVRYEAVA